MPALPATLAVITLLASAPAQSGSTSSHTGGGRPLLLSASAPEQEFEVRMGADTSLNLLFDARVHLVGLEGREHFRRVTVTEDSILLMASRELKWGQRLRMPVRFLDGSAPAQVDFLLVVVPPDQAERQVDVYRPRSLESSQEEAREEREKARQCQAELIRERAERKTLGALTGLLVAKQMNAEGVVTRKLAGLPRLAGEQLKAFKPVSYRATRADSESPGEQRRQVRVALELWLTNESARPWLTAGAELVSGSGARWSAAAWQEAPAAPASDWQRVVVEAEMPEAQARGSFTLELSEEDRTRTVTFGGVSFP